MLIKHKMLAHESTPPADDQDEGNEDASQDEAKSDELLSASSAAVGAVVNRTITVDAWLGTSVDVKSRRCCVDVMIY